MSGPPVVSAVFDKPEYTQGDLATLNIAVEADTISKKVQRVAVLQGHDNEGNEVEAEITTTVTVQVPDNFVLDAVYWKDSGEEFSRSLNGLQATGKA